MIRLIGSFEPGEALGSLCCPRKDVIIRRMNRPSVKYTRGSRLQIHGPGMNRTTSVPLLLLGSHILLPRSGLSPDGVHHCLPPRHVSFCCAWLFRHVAHRQVSGPQWPDLLVGTPSAHQGMTAWAVARWGTLEWKQSRAKIGPSCRQSCKTSMALETQCPRREA